MRSKLSLAGILACGALLLAGVSPAAAVESAAQELPTSVVSLTSESTESTEYGEVDPESYVLPGDTIPTLPIEGSWSTSDSDSSGISPMIAPVACGSRIDWYRLVETSGKNHCYRDAGTRTYLNHYRVKGQCPGANKGRFQYKINGVKYWSQTRGPVSNYRTCYWFANNGYVSVDAVQIY